MGGLASIMDMMPGMGKKSKQLQDQVDEAELRKIEAIIRSMTPEEREHPEIIKASRRRRIALGSGTKPVGCEPGAEPVQADAAADEAVFQQPQRADADAALGRRMPPPG